MEVLAFIANRMFPIETVEIILLKTVNTQLISGRPSEAGKQPDRHPHGTWHGRRCAIECAESISGPGQHPLARVDAASYTESGEECVRTQRGAH